ncbi:MAG: hypothetical protein GY928_00310 [Colwellia sp.]|nr:hypothetical protein [Colwellia sp.]
MMRYYIYFTRITLNKRLNISIHDTESGDFKGFKKLRITKDDGGWSIRTLTRKSAVYKTVKTGITQLNFAKYIANVMYNSDFDPNNKGDVDRLLYCCGISPTSKFYQAATGHNGRAT